MKTFYSILFIIAPVLLGACSSKQPGKHLFILSGQSNMAGLLPDESFIPALQAEFGKEKIIVVKDAHGGKPIRRWYKDWKPPVGINKTAQPDLYDSLMNKVSKAIEDEKLATVTFIWMQGERDAAEKLDEVYEESLVGLYSQLSKDLERNDVNFVIGRLSDFGLENRKSSNWAKIREIQVKVAESNSRFEWVSTDDLNDGTNRRGKEIKNDLHMSQTGYVVLGKRFADKSIELIRKNK